MSPERSSDQVEQVFREALEDDDPENPEGEPAILLGAPQAPPPDNRRPDPDAPPTLDPSRTDVERNAAGGGWEGAGEVVESDYESEQLRARHPEGGATEGRPDPDPDEGQPDERLRP